MSKYAVEWKEELIQRKTEIEKEINDAKEETDRTYSRSRIIHNITVSNVRSKLRKHYEEKILTDDTILNEVEAKHKDEIYEINAVLEAIDRTLAAT